MGLSNFQSLRELSNDQIQELIITSKKELFNLRLQKATRQSFKPNNFKHLKRKISQLMTLESQRKNSVN